MKVTTQNTIKKLFLDHYQEWCLHSFSYLKNMDNAEDVVQDVFVKLLDVADQKDILNLKNYVTAMVRNSSLTKAKQLGKVISINSEDLQSINLISDVEEEINVELTQKVKYSLETLPEQSRKVVELCVIDGLRYEVAAKELGISINTVKYHLKKAFKMLRCSLQNVHLFTPIIYIFLCFFLIF